MRDIAGKDYVSKELKVFQKKIKCIGYQHTPVINSNYSIKRNIQRNYDPDIIWCTSKQSFYCKLKIQKR